MGRLDERLHDHRVHEAVAALRQSLTDLPDETRLALDEALSGVTGRVSEVADHLNGLLAAADARFVPPAALDQLAGHADQASAALQGAATDATAQAAALDQALDNALDAAAPIAAASQLISSTASDIHEKFGSTIDTKSRDLQARLDEIDSELTSLDEQRRSREQEITAA